MQEAFLIRFYQLTSLWRVGWSVYWRSWCHQFLGILTVLRFCWCWETSVLFPTQNPPLLSLPKALSYHLILPRFYANIPTVTWFLSNTLCIPHTELSHYENLMMSFLKLKPSRASLCYFLTISSKSSLWPLKSYEVQCCLSFSLIAHLFCCLKSNHSDFSIWSCSVLLSP